MAATTPAALKSSNNPQDRRELILDVALELFTKHGDEGTSIEC
jgi:AcrR family transcriptional regulator